jgi:signal peptidase I
MQSIKSFLKDLVWVVVLSVVVVLPLRLYIAQPFIVSGESMNETFSNGNYVIVDEISYRFKEPKRGDVIIFKVPTKALSLLHYDLNKKIFFIKRIIGLPGETVEIKGDQVKIYNEKNLEGFVLEENYTFIDKSSSYYKNIELTVKLGSDEYFVMGDNRHNSSDSRIWGTLKKENISGQAFLRLFPFNKISAFPGKFNDYK